MNTLTAYIEAALPELQLEKVTVDENGQNNHVLLVNDKLVFRFPKYEKGLQQLQAEAQLLETIADRVPLPVPRPLYKSFGELESSFAAYEMLPGKPLWRPVFANIADKETLAQQLGGFLAALHAQPLAAFAFLTYEPEAVRNLYVRIREKLFSHMRLDARTAVAALFENFLECENAVKPVLIHGDFGASNLLYDERTAHIAGVIDFGGAGLGDPAYDFAGILACYGEEFLQACLRYYPVSAGLAERIYFYKETFALQEALHGVETGDEAAFQSGIAGYR